MHVIPDGAHVLVILDERGQALTAQEMDELHAHLQELAPGAKFICISGAERAFVRVPE